MGSLRFGAPGVSPKDESGARILMIAAADPTCFATV